MILIDHNYYSFFSDHTFSHTNYTQQQQQLFSYYNQPTMEEALDQLRTMLLREKRYGRQDYIGCFDPDNTHSIVTDDTPQKVCFGEEHRFRLCEWAVQGW